MVGWGPGGDPADVRTAEYSDPRGAVTGGSESEHMESTSQPEAGLSPPRGGQDLGDLGWIYRGGGCGGTNGILKWRTWAGIQG